jgi:hypothetical protein
LINQLFLIFGQVWFTWFYSSKAKNYSRGEKAIYNGANDLNCKARYRVSNCLGKDHRLYVPILLVLDTSMAATGSG